MKQSARKDEPGNQVKALFLDYDGTIGPINVPKSESFVPSRVSAVLHKISKQIPIAIITTKSLHYVVPRTPFAHAWSALGGLETRIGDVISKVPCLQNAAVHFTSALQYAKSQLGDDMTIEEKRDFEGNVAGFSVDWRQCKDCSKARDKASSISSYCEALPLTVINYEKQPFFDVFPCSISKGQALMNLKEELGLSRGILYMGDSTVDNSAFEMADFSVGVIHAETHEGLSSTYFLKLEDVPTFLNHLSENNMYFDAGFPLLVKENSKKPL